MSDNNTGTPVVRKKYSPRFKDQALERAAKDGVPQGAKDLGKRIHVVFMAGATETML